MTETLTREHLELLRDRACELDERTQYAKFMGVPLHVILQLALIGMGPRPTGVEAGRALACELRRSRAKVVRHPLRLAASIANNIAPRYVIDATELNDLLDYIAVLERESEELRIYRNAPAFGRMHNVRKKISQLKVPHAS